MNAAIRTACALAVGFALVAPALAWAFDANAKHQQTFDGDVAPAVPDPAPRNVRLLANVGYAQVATDIWGYTAPDGREYACMGLLHGVTIVDITEPESPVEVAFLQGDESQWRDLKTLGHYLYVVADDGDDGLVIIDLSELPNRARIAAKYEGFAQAHNLYIDTGSALAFIAGTELSNGGVRILDLSDPVSPVLRGIYDENYVHDVHARNGVLFTFEAFEGGSVIDVNDPDNPIALSRLNYPRQAYTHSGWATEDMEYLLINDEYDELPDTKHGDGGGDHGSVVRTRLIVMRRAGDGFDYEPFSEYHGPSRASDHNVFVHGEFAYVSNYTFGLGVVDIGDIANPAHYGHYDTFPSTDDAGFAGAWGVYPFFPSGAVILSDRSSGLWIFELLGDRDRDGLPDAEDPNPDTPDSDADGLPDGWETTHGLDAFSAAGIDGADGDPDMDGLNNLWEYRLGSDPNRRDTDGDGLTDGEEHDRGSDPADAHSPPSDTGGVDAASGCAASGGSPSGRSNAAIVTGAIIVLATVRRRRFQT